MMLKETGIGHPLVVLFTGIACGICIQADFSGLIFCLVMLSLLFSLARLPHLFIGVALGFIAILLSPQPVWLEGEHAIEGRVVACGFEHGIYRIELTSVRLDGKAIQGKARLNVYDNVGCLERIVIRTTATINQPRPLGNIGEFNYARNLLSQGVTVTGSIKDFRNIAPSPERQINPRARDLTTDAVSLLSDMARPDAEILKAVLFGDRSGLSYSIGDTIASLGLSHLIAISGLNIGLIVLFGYILAYTCIRIIPPLAVRLDTPLVAKVIGLFCATFYVFLVEPSYPTTRSILMAVVVISALVFARRTDPLDALSLSGIIILFIWPWSLFTVSFLLSFAAVLGLIVVLDRMKKSPMALQFIAVTIAASTFTLPIAGYMFGFVAPFGIIHNLVFVPLFSFLVMPLGLLGLLASIFYAPATAVLFSLAMDTIDLILWAGDRFGWLVSMPKPHISWVYLSYLGLICAFFARRSKMQIALLALISTALIILPTTFQAYNRSRSLTFDFINVGQGDCILVTKGEHAILIDAGGSPSGFDTGRLIVAPHILTRGFTALDLVVITHSHPDHAGGIPFILQRFPVGQVWINTLQDPDFDAVTRITSLKSIPLKAVSRGEQLAINGLKIEVLHPQKIHTQHNGLDLNLHSIVLRMGDGRMRGLFMADAGWVGELTLAHLEQDLSADVLKVAHHGAAKTCLDVFLERVQPRMAVITCGYRNRYHVPAPEVLNRLRQKGIMLYRTDLDGEVKIFSYKGGIAIKSGKDRADR